MELLIPSYTGETAKFLRRDYNLHDPEHSPFEYFPEHQYLKELYTGGFLYEEIPAIVSQFQYKDVFAWDVYEKIAELKMTEELEAREGIPAPKPEVSINGQESEKVGALGVAMWTTTAVKIFCLHKFLTKSLKLGWRRFNLNPHSLFHPAQRNHLRYSIK